MRIPEWLRLRLRAWAHKKTQTPPDFIIRPQGRDQTLRWWVIPRNRFFNIYLHKFVLSDEDRALHCHPWLNASILIEGSYIEHRRDRDPELRKAGYIYFRRATTAHRIQLLEKGVGKYDQNGKIYDHVMPVITLFVTGPKIREWGFWCPQGWRHWKDFCDARDHGVIGRGCE